MLEELIEIRHYLHQHPELSGKEYKTTKFLTKQLQEHDIRIVPTSLETGVIAEIGDAKKGPTIALRADIDALPITEQTELSFASVNEGVMHACGHDLHQTSLLGAAFRLKAAEAQLPGLVRLIFQPAEEGHFGAEQVLQAGHLQDVQAIVGYHNHPALPVGTIALKAEGIMAAVDHFKVTVTGVGTHAAAPHSGVDVLVTTSAIIQSLQSIVSRNISPLDPVVVSVTHMEAGNTWNVLPDKAFFEGTIRSFSTADRQLSGERLTAVIEQTAQTYGATAEVELIAGPPVTFNDPKLTAWVTAASEKIATVIPAEASTAGEDFAYYQEHIPGVFAFIGSNGVPTAPAWHHSNFMVDDAALSVAVDYYVASAKKLLTVLK